MHTNHKPTAPTQPRSVRKRAAFAAALVAATAVLFGSALGDSAVANAAQEWDIGAYDDCMKKTIRDAAWCCIESGGVVTDVNAQDGSGCAAPPAEQQSGRNPLLNDAPTHVIQPSPLPNQGPVINPSTGGVS